MTTNEERREVAQRMFETMMKGFDFSSYNIADNIGIEYPSDLDGCFEDEREEAWKRLIDLIEPLPERTCIPEYHGIGPTEFTCSVCGDITLPTLYWVAVDGLRTVKKHDAKYCSNCGAKVVN